MTTNQDISPEGVQGDCCRLLAACFYLPQKTVWLEEGLLHRLAELLDRICPPAAEPARRMAELLPGCDAEALAVEYARLFVGPRRVLAPPYGSVWLEEGRRVMGDSTLDALQAYRNAGLRLEADFTELPDHVAVELEFLYYLTAAALAAEAAGRAEEAAGRRAAREAFLDRHLRRWAPPFCARIAEGTGHPFYRHLADCLAAFVAGLPAGDPHSP
jgi:TorA maturation chaperone TorD